MKKIELDFEKIKKAYQDGLSLRNVGIKFDCGFKVIMRIMNENNFIRTRNTYTLNEKYFDIIDDNNKAYILGLLYADGSIASDYNFYISLQEQDKYILDNINKILESDRNLYITDKTKEGLGKYYKLSISNVYMIKSLYKLCLMKDKAFKIQYPINLSEQFFFDFLRGVFDGDGCFYIDKRRKRVGHFSITSNVLFCKQLQAKLLEYGIISQVYENKTHPKVAEIRVGKFEYVKKLFDKIYGENPELYLTRKYKKAKEFTERC